MALKIPPPAPAPASSTPVVIMTPSKTISKDGMKKSGIPKRAEVDEENYCNEELEKQIQEEMERAQDQSRVERSESTVEVEEMGDEVEKIEDRAEKNVEKSTFHFAVPRPVTAPKCKISGKTPVTPTKISEDMNFLKKPINDLSSTPKPVLKKNPKITKEIENILLGQILSKLKNYPRL